ncbi:MAG: elongation factor 1-beta [Thermoprotei archaeon]
MAKVLVIVKVFPEDINIDLTELRSKIEKNLPEGYEVKAHEEIPIAFGLKALRLYIIMPEIVEGGTETLENAISSVEGVSQVEVEVVHRISE